MTIWDQEKIQQLKILYESNKSPEEIAKLLNVKKSSVKYKASALGIAKKHKYDFSDYLKIFNEVHGNKYGYEEFVYINRETKGKIHCRNCNDYFYQNAHDHRNGRGCPECANKIRAEKSKLSTNEFISKAIEIHNDNYKYDKTVYLKSDKKVLITCIYHGDFYITPNAHLSRKTGCPKCKITFLHRTLVDLIKNLNVPVLINDRNVLNGKELDIYVPSHNLAVEINGLYWHRHEFLKDRNYHNNKFKECEKLGITLIQFWEIDLKNYNELAKSMIKAKLNLVDEKIYARKTDVRFVDQKTFASFLENNHIQGKTSAKVRLGLYEGDRLVAVMGFANINKEIHLVRYCNLVNTLIVGGFSKLLKHGKAIYNNESIVSFSDNFYSNGNVYKANGFELIKENSPRLHYTDYKNLYDRRNFQKKKLLKLVKDANVNMKEKEIAALAGYYQIYGGGTKKWLLP